MILNTEQIGKLVEYRKHVAAGDSKVVAADKVGVAASTLRNWDKAENAPTQEAVADKPKKAPKAAKAPKVAKPKAERAPRSKKAPKAPKVAASKVDPIAKAPKVEAVDPEELVPFQYISLPTTLTVVRDGRAVQIDKSHTNFKDISEIITSLAGSTNIKRGVLNKLHDLIDMKSVIENWAQGRITVTGSSVLVDGKQMVGQLAQVLIRSLKDSDQKALARFANFHEKVSQAISFKVTNRLFEFITKTGLRIDDDGDIIALKVVRNTYMDKHSNTFDNSPGKEVKMERNAVDDRDEVTCSNGLHVCAPGYITHFANNKGGDRLVECKVDPRDFVSVPTDYNFDKARVCRYIVLGDVTSAYKKEMYEV